MERESLGRASTPQGGRVELVREGERLVIYVDGLLLMTSNATTSEVAMAELGCRDLGAGARVLVGGLGLGYTLRAVLDVVSSDARVVCAELLEALGRWHRDGPLGPPVDHAVRDPRVELHIGDIVAYLASSAEESFDAILLDVDNGPVAMTVNGNQSLYSVEGLENLLRLLRPGGVVIIWSAEDFPRFAARMTDVGFATETHQVDAGPTAESVGVQHVLFLGRKAGGTDTSS